jgi:hypothetical protein
MNKYEINHLTFYFFLLAEKEKNKLHVVTAEVKVYLSGF